MGNSSSRKAKIDEIYSVLSDNVSQITERESSSTWFRQNVEITDVYDVLKVLGQGHMGEVFTVRRKTTGHHNTKDTERRHSLSSESTPPGHSRKTSGGSFGAFRKKKSDETNPSNSLDTSGHSKPKRVSVSKVKHKLKFGSDDTVKADATLGKHIVLDREDTPESFHEPPALTAKPAKGIIRKEGMSKHKSTPSNMSVELNVKDVGSDMSKLSMDRILSVGDNTEGSSEEGSGSNSKLSGVNKGVHFQRVFAVKTILTSRVNKAQVEEMVNEIMIMRKLDHPYVLKLYEVYQVKRKIWLVTELCTGGDLSTRKLNEHSAKNVIEQILRALVYLHRLGVVHRDLKLENVLYESSAKDASIRLIDFGLSRAFDRTSVLNDYSRTPYTMTPEAVEGKNMEDLHTDKADMWAVGVIAFVLLSGNFPFVKNTADLKDKSKLEILKQANLHFGVTWKGRGITSQAKEFVTGCLQKDPEKRWTAKQALENLQTNWAPAVDKIWDEWRAEMKKMKEPEFVRAEDLEDLSDDEEDTEADALARANAIANAALENEDETKTPLSKDEARARQQRIKKHVTKVVVKKKRESQAKPIELGPEEEVDIMGEIEKYTQFGSLKKKILITMANTMDRNEVVKLREWFMNADTMHTGTITLQELKDAFKKVSPDVEDSKIKLLFDEVDRDHSGHIHYDEFLAALAESHGLVTMDRLTEAFDRIDREGKGYINHEDLKEMLGSDYDKETVDKMIEEGDFKKNNQIDYEELLQYMFSDPAQGDQLVGHVTPQTIDIVHRASYMLNQDSDLSDIEESMTSH